MTENKEQITEEQVVVDEKHYIESFEKMSKILDSVPEKRRVNIIKALVFLFSLEDEIFN